MKIRRQKRQRTQKSSDPATENQVLLSKFKASEPEPKDTPKPASQNLDESLQLGSKVAKSFEHSGSVEKIWTWSGGNGSIQRMWHVKYDDGDKEDMSFTDVVKAVALFEGNGKVAEGKKKRKTAQKASLRQSDVKVGTGIAKAFVHFGFVESIWTWGGQDMYHIRYEDGDEEDISRKDCKEAREFFLQQQQP
ncbi:MAG: hypothetical protein SGILL_009935 [Bacillariaceae sp.]